ncbi:MAG: hypothetical protein M1546_10135 [Chloroflexi bacterium]|nr:hypothetical protein [Chloroflexota bacterium]
MISDMEPRVAMEPAPRVTFGQIEAVLRDVPVDLLPEVYEYLTSLVASAIETPNALTRQVFEDSDAGRNMHEYRTVEELFDALNAAED